MPLTAGASGGNQWSYNGTSTTCATVQAASGAKIIVYLCVLMAFVACLTKHHTLFRALFMLLTIPRGETDFISWSSKILSKYICLIGHFSEQTASGTVCSSSLLVHCIFAISWKQLSSLVEKGAFSTLIVGYGRAPHILVRKTADLPKSNRISWDSSRITDQINTSTTK